MASLNIRRDLSLRVLLVPDAGAARRLISERGAWNGVMGGGLSDHPMLVVDVE